jgi:tRNA A37 methylthiotransferase MiaB
MEYKIFGCKVNKYYTDEWLNSDYLSDKKGIFIASCVVTDNAKRKWIKFIKDTGKEIPDTHKMYISGCGAFTD